MRLQIRKLMSLSRSESLGALDESFPKDFYSRLKPELQALTSAEDFGDINLLEADNCLPILHPLT